MERKQKEQKVTKLKKKVRCCNSQMGNSHVKDTNVVKHQRIFHPVPEALSFNAALKHMSRGTV